jgi:hypothetical protein
MKGGFNIKHLLFLLMLGLLAFPLIQNTFTVFKVEPLKGAITPAADTAITVDGWFSGDYQSQKENYLNEEFGLRNIFIRFNNEIAFKFYNKALANNVVIGKQNYLYEEDYIKAYYGRDFIGMDSISKRMHKLKFLQDTLAKLNKTLIFIIAPGKGTFYPEYFPDNLKSEKGPTNYEAYVKLANELGINYIDFDKYFVENKNKSKYLLYPKYGIHWSYYGECLAADSIVKYIEKKRNIRMPHISWNDIEIDKPRERDADIEDGMNLLFNLRGPQMAYPKLIFESDSGKAKVSSMVISDSFYWGMFNFGFSNVFSSSQFWYYNNQVYPDFYQNGLTTDQVNVKEQVNKHDVVIILCTDAKLGNLGWGFIEKAYKVFTEKEVVQHDAGYYARVKELENYIRTDKKWMALVEKGAKEKGISVDSSLTLNATWTIEHPAK